MVRSTRVACGVLRRREALGRPEVFSLLRRDVSGLPEGAGNSSRPAEQLLSFLMRFLESNRHVATNLERGTYILISSSRTGSLVCRTHFPLLMKTLTSNSRSMFGSCCLGGCDVLPVPELCNGLEWTRCSLPLQNIYGRFCKYYILNFTSRRNHTKWEFSSAVRLSPRRSSNDRQPSPADSVPNWHWEVTTA